MHTVEDLSLHLLAALGPAESIEVTARATDATLAVSASRLFVVGDDRVLLSVAINRIRRIEYDVERGRPATLVIVPEEPSDEPQVLVIPPESYDSAARAVALLGQKLASSSSMDRP